MREKCCGIHGNLDLILEEIVWSRRMQGGSMAEMIRCGLLFLIFSTAVFSQSMLTADRIDAIPANQLLVAGNACGPAALMNSFRYGDAAWQKALDRLEKPNDREQMLAIIRQYGGRPSLSLKGHQRWSKRGINLADLADIGNEMAREFFLPRLTTEVFFAKQQESSEKFLKTTHASLHRSLKKGFPPILSVRRFVYRDGQWQPVFAHFVTLIGLPDRLEKHATSFPITYLDPWGGKRFDGEISASLETLQSGMPKNLEAKLPHTGVGKSLVKSGEISVVVLSAAILR